MTRHTEVEVGDEYATAGGETIEVTNERDDEVCLYFPGRDGVDGGAYTEWRPRASFAAQVDFENMVRVGEADDQPTETVDGEFTDGPVRCPTCSGFMSTGYDTEGFPVASCTRETCDQTAVGDGWLIAEGHFDA